MHFILLLLLLMIMSLKINFFTSLFNRAVVYPFQYSYAKKQCFISIAIIWIFSCLYSIRSVFWFEMVPEKFTKDGHLLVISQCSIPESAKGLLQQFVIIDFFVIYLIPLMAINCIHFIIIRKMNLESVRVRPSSNRDKKSRLKKRRIIKMLTVIAIIFAVCQLPEHVYNIYRYRVGTFPGYIIVHEVCDLITFSNSWLNVIVYAVLNDNFSRHFKSHLLCCTGRNKNSSNQSVPEQTEGSEYLRARRCSVPSVKVSPCTPRNTSKGFLKPLPQKLLPHDQKPLPQKPSTSADSNSSRKAVNNSCLLCPNCLPAVSRTDPVLFGSKSSRPSSSASMSTSRNMPDTISSVHSFCNSKVMVPKESVMGNKTNGLFIIEENSTGKNMPLASVTNSE